MQPHGMMRSMIETAAQAYTIPQATNRRLIVGIVGLHLMVLGGLPFLLAQSIGWAALIPMLAWVNVTHWALIHEAIHKLLHPDTQTNETFGRLLGVLLGASFHMLRFGHLMHHKLNRDWHSELVSEKNLMNSIRYYAHLLFGLYGSEVLTSTLVAILPKEVAIRIARRTALKYHPDVAIAGERFFYTRGNVRMLRQDMAMSVALYGIAFWHFGAMWPVLAAFIALRALVISFVDNIYHYGTDENNSKAGKELTLAPFYSKLVLHGNYHETHHLNPEVPWSSLPAMHNAQGRIFNGRFMTHGMQQFHGPMLSPNRHAPMQHAPAPRAEFQLQYA